MFLGVAHQLDYSVLDDVVLIRAHEGLKPRLFSVELNKEEKLPSVVNTTCTVNRAHESETLAKREHFYYAVQCKNFLGLFSLRYTDMEIQVVFKTQSGSNLGSHSHGLLRRSFKSPANLIVQLGDLSLHNMDIAKVEKKWTREEALSRVKQVEVI